MYIESKKLIFYLRRNLKQCWSAVLISRNHSITHLISYTKNGSAFGPSRLTVS
jgi:hypothetical protein